MKEKKEKFDQRGEKRKREERDDGTNSERLRRHLRDGETRTGFLNRACSEVILLIGKVQLFHKC